MEEDEYPVREVKFQVREGKCHEKESQVREGQCHKEEAKCQATLEIYMVENCASEMTGFLTCVAQARKVTGHNVEP
jgi:hypothetical protein